MPPYRLPLIARTAITTFALALAALGTAGSASADYSESTDEIFLGQMASLGIAFPSPNGAVREAHQLCTKLTAGESVVGVTTDIVRNTDLTTDRAIRFVAASIQAYCPQNRVFTSPADAAPEVMFGDLVGHLRP